MEKEMTISEAGRVLRNSASTKEEKSRAASVLGKRGGKNSHNNDGKKVA